MNLQMNLQKNSQRGFTIIESIIIIAIAAALVLAIYHFGWGIRGTAGETALETHLDLMQKAVDLYMFDSNGLYPTDDGKLPEEGQYKLIVWDAAFTYGGKQLSFYPNYLKRLPKYANQAVWRIDSAGKVSAIINPEDY